MRSHLIQLCLMLAAFVLPEQAFAANSVALSSEVFLERTISEADGKSKVLLLAPTVVTPGDRLIFILNYHNVGATPANNFVITNPLPEAVSYQGAADPTAQVSIDGGKVWGSLTTLKVQEADGTSRAARPEDVTHVRWAMKNAIPAGAQGKLSFRGLVR
jgi:uncharacterized repeat protein (TIGR01451 family)